MKSLSSYSKKAIILVLYGLLYVKAKRAAVAATPTVAKMYERVLIKRI
jgi:hypothetical protein